MPVDLKISELDFITAEELLLNAEFAVAPVGSPKTRKTNPEEISKLIGSGEKFFMAATDPLIETGRESDNWLNTDVGTFWKKQGGIWVLKYQFAGGTGSNVNQSFETLIYAASKSVAYNPNRPKKKITLTGNISITNTNTVNGSQGIYLLIQDATGNRAANINGTAIKINPSPESRTIIGWMYDGTDYDFSSNYNPGSSFYIGISNDFDNTFQLL